MIIDNRKILVAIVLLSLLLFPIVLFTSGPVRIVLGMIFILFFPGYTMISALFPKQQDLSTIERITLSFGTSIAVVPLIGLILNYTPWGIKLSPIFLSIVLFIVIMSAIAWFRHIRLASYDRLSINLRLNELNWSSQNRVTKGLSIVLIIIIIAAIGSVIYIISSPKDGEKYTEFYLLDSDGKADHYPRQLLFTHPADLIIGVINHEQQTATYCVEIKINNVSYEIIDIGELADGQKHEQKISINLKELGDNQKIEFLLYMNNSNTPYFDNPLYLYVDVTTFRVADIEGKPLSYITLRPNDSMELVVNIINIEPQPASYKLQVSVAGILYEETFIDDLTFEKEWQKQFSISPELYISQQKVECLLYRETNGIPKVEQSKSFIIEIGAPYAPQLLSPADKADVPGNFITYTWDSSPGATSYVLEINTDPEWANQHVKFKEDVGNVTEYTDADYQNDGTTYYWRVFSKNDTERSPLSETDDNSRKFINK
jgi:uncharacterized membrane protein